MEEAGSSSLGNKCLTSRSFDMILPILTGYVLGFGGLGLRTKSANLPSITSMLQPKLFPPF